MSYPYVSLVTGNVNAGSSVLTINNVVAGNTLVYAAAHANGTNAVPTDTAGQTWQSVTFQLNAGGAGVAVYWLPNANAGTHTVTWAGTGYVNAALGQYLPISGIDAVGTAASSTGGNPSTITATLTQTTPVDILIAVIAINATADNNNAYGLSAPTGFTQLFVANDATAANVGEIAYWARDTLSPSISATWNFGLDSTGQAVEAIVVGLTLAAVPVAKPLNVKGPLFARMALPNAGDTTIGLAGTNTNLTPGVGSIAFTGYAPTIAQPQTANPGAASIVFTGYAPTVVQPQTAAPGAASITFTGYAPTVSQPQTAAPGAVSIAFTGYAATVVQDTPLSPGVASITFTGYAPSISQPQTAAPGAGTITFTGYAPTVSQPQTAAPGFGSIAFTGYAPTVTLNQNVAPGVGPISFTGYAPTVAQTSNQSVVPDPGLVAFTGYAPMVTQAPASQSLVPDPGVLTLTGYAPTVVQASASVGGNPWGYGKKKNRAQVQAEVNRLNLEILKAELEAEAKTEIESVPWADEEDEIEMLLLA